MAATTISAKVAHDEDFQFLRPDPRKLAEEQNQPFDGKKMCWIPDQKEGYIKSEIISTKGEDVTVSTDNQDVSPCDCIMCPFTKR